MHCSMTYNKIIYLTLPFKGRIDAKKLPFTSNAIENLPITECENLCLDVISASLFFETSTHFSCTAAVNEKLVIV